MNITRENSETLSAGQRKILYAGVVIEQFQFPGSRQEPQTADEQKKAGKIAAQSKSIRPRNHAKAPVRTRNQEA